LHRGIVAYIVIFIILLILGGFFVFHPFGTQPSTTTTLQGGGQGNGKSTSGNINGSSTATSTSTTTISYSTCLSSNATEPIKNGNFSSGTYAGWNTTGPGFGTVPFNLTYANENNEYYGSKWTGYNGSYAASTYHGGLTVEAGNITSAPFEVTEPYLNFKIVGGQTALNYVAIMQKNKTVFEAHFDTYAVNNPYPTSTFVNASIRIGRFLCQNVSIRVVGGVTAGSTQTQYIVVGDFHMSSASQSTPGIVTSQNYTG
jgi:hypothetical protein